jgi:hypothetical protein
MQEQTSGILSSLSVCPSRSVCRRFFACWLTALSSVKRYFPVRNTSFLQRVRVGI